jgi:hypothetical protein
MKEGRLRIILRLLVSVLAVVCVLACSQSESPSGPSQPDSDQPTAAEPQTVYVNSPEGLFLRAASSAQGAKIALIPYGEPVSLSGNMGPVDTIDSVTAQWLEVVYAGTGGWVFGGYVGQEKPELSKITGHAVGVVRGYDRIGAYNIDTHWFYVIENHARPFIGGIEDPDLTAEEAAEIGKKISQENDDETYFELGDLPPGRYAVYTWNSKDGAQSDMCIQKPSQRSEETAAQIGPRIISLKKGEVFSEVEFPDDILYAGRGLPGQYSSLADSGEEYAPVADAVTTTRDTTLYSVKFDHVTRQLSTGGRQQVVPAGTTLYPVKTVQPWNYRYKTFIAVTDGAGQTWWADAFDLAVGCLVLPEPVGLHGEKTLRNVAYVLGRSDGNWICRRIGPGQTLAYIGALDSEKDSPPGANRVRACIMLEAEYFKLKGFGEDGPNWSDDPVFWTDLREELIANPAKLDYDDMFKLLVPRSP